MRSRIAWLAYVALGAIHKLFRPYRVQPMNGGFWYLGKDAVWYVGPEDKVPRRMSE